MQTIRAVLAGVEVLQVGQLKHDALSVVFLYVPATHTAHGDPVRPVDTLAFQGAAH